MKYSLKFSLKMTSIFILLSGLVFSWAQASVTVKPKSHIFYACNAGVSQQSSQALAGTNSVAVLFEDLLVSDDSPLRFRGNTVIGDFSGNFTTLATGNQYWGLKLNSLNFAFSTEQTGARYYVDYCYVGPQLSGPQLAQAQGIYELDLSVFATDFGDAGYGQNVGLTTQSMIICDLANTGSKKQMNASVQEIVQSGFDRDFQTTTAEAPFVGQVLQISKVLNSHVRNIPRACVVRMIFSEKASRQRSTGMMTEVTTDLLINERNY